MKILSPTVLAVCALIAYVPTHGGAAEWSASELEAQRVAKAKRDADTREIAVLDAGCELGSVKYGSYTTVHSIYRITGWTGGCKDGRRDGAGVLSVRYDSFNPTKGPAIESSSWVESEGTFVDGKRQGLWCTTASKSTYSIVTVNVFPLSCTLMVDGSRIQYSFRMAADGTWRLANGDGDADPPTYLPVGLLESESQRLIADAIAGRPETIPVLPASVPAVGDLFRDGKMLLGANIAPPDLRSKRVAVVLSARATGEIERFRAMRNALIEVSAKRIKDGSEYRDQFIALSEPNQIIGSLISGMRRGGAIVIPAEDLSVLESGAVDYALIFDWHFEGDFALTEKQYKAVPGCSVEAGQKCPTIFQSAAGLIVLDPKLRAVRQLDWKDPKITRRTNYTHYWNHFLQLRTAVDDWDLNRGTARIKAEQLVRGL